MDQPDGQAGNDDSQARRQASARGAAMTTSGIGELAGAPGDALELLRVSGLTTEQVGRLRCWWPNLDADLWSQPHFRDVREHARAFIERRAKEFVDG